MIWCPALASSPFPPSLPLPSVKLPIRTALSCLPPCWVPDFKQPSLPTSVPASTELWIWGSENIATAPERGPLCLMQQWRGKGEGSRCIRGSPPHPSPPPSWLPTLQPAPTRQLPAFQDFELGRTPGRFISEGAENGRRRRSKRLSQCPAQAGMGGIFQIKTQLAGTQACRESLPLDAAWEGWVCKTGAGVGGQARRGTGCGGGLPCSPPRGCYQTPPPRTEGARSEPGGPPDTKGLFASCPHLLGLALGWALGAAYASACASRHPSSTPASRIPEGSPESAAKAKGPWVVTFGTGQGGTRVS